MNDLEVWTEHALKDAGAPPWEREHEFARKHGRMWRFDFAWPGDMVALECEGGVHRIRDKFARDVEKYNSAEFLGWRVFRITAAMIREEDWEAYTGAKFITQFVHYLRGSNT